MHRRAGYFKFVLIAAILTVFLSACQNSTEQQIAEQLELGTRYLNEGDYEEAVIAFQKVISVDKKNVAAYLGMADAYIGLNKLDMAKEILESGLSEVDDEQLRKKLEEVLRLIEEEHSEEAEKDGSMAEKQEAADEETTKTDADTAVPETMPTGPSASETAQAAITESSASETTEAIMTESSASETTEAAMTESLATETTKAAMTDPPVTEAAQGQGLMLKITEPISIGSSYLLEDVIDGIQDTTTLSDIEHQISGLTCDVVRGKDDKVSFYKDGTYLFSIAVTDILMEEEWNKFLELESPLQEAFNIYGDFSGPNVDKLLVIERQVRDEEKAYLLDKPLRKDITVWWEEDYQGE